MFVRRIVDYLHCLQGEYDHEGQCSIAVKKAVALYIDLHAVGVQKLSHLLLSDLLHMLKKMYVLGRSLKTNCVSQVDFLLI